MLRQLTYFQAIVRNNSFSAAAEECHISQSAISQQIQALERDLGFLLFLRKNRKFELTPAGEHFYKKSLIVMADYEQLCREAARIANKEHTALTMGVLRGYIGTALHAAMAAFNETYPTVEIRIIEGNHEELYEFLKTEKADVVFNDQRRAFSDEYVNLVLADVAMYIEIAARNPVAGLDTISPHELKNMPCILISSKEQQATERNYYRDVMGFQGEFLFAETIEQARLLISSGKGFMPIAGESELGSLSASISRIPLYRNQSPMHQRFCAFWKADNSGYYIEELASMLKKQFGKHK